MNNKKQKEFILTENLTKIMWRLSLPAIAAMVLFGLNSFMDTVYIGQLMNEQALSGVALAYPLTGILLGLGSWAGTGAGNSLSILLGKDDKEQQSKIVANTALFSFFSAAIVTIPTYLFAEELIALLGGRGEILGYGTKYLQTTLLFSPFWVYGLALNFIVRSEGKMKQAATMMSYGLAVNLVLTPIFIHYFRMGVEGAAWATNVGMAIYSVVGYLYFARGKATFVANHNSLKYDKEVFKDISRLGLPGFILTIMGLVQAIVVFNAIVNTGSDRDLAFYAAVNRIMFFLMTPLFGLMRAMQPVVGINYGAGNIDRVKQSFILFCKAGFFLILPFWILLMIFPESSVALVLPDIQFLGTDTLNARIYLLVLPFLPVVFMALTLFPAVNKDKQASIIGLARQVVFYVPAMWFLPKLFGVEWVYYGSTIIDIVITLWTVLAVVILFKNLAPPVATDLQNQDASRDNDCAAVEV